YAPAALGFARRLAMGVDHSIRAHYLHPERYFERALFSRLMRAGFEYERSNALGEWTLRYDVRISSTNMEISDWIPRWAMRTIRWTLRKTEGLCPFKLDWFATRGVRLAKGEGAIAPRVLHGLEHGGRRVSDHEPIVLDVV